MTKKNSALPSSVIRRLTRYLTEVQMLRERDVEWVASHELAEGLGLTSSTVRQDLTHLDFSGTSKRGYETAGLERVLNRVLGADTEWRMVVVGAGNLGRALAVHEDFPRRGFKVVGVFDADKQKIGMRLGSVKVRGMRELPGVVRRERVDVGIIAVPAHAAQSAADLLIAAGVRGLLNLALTHVIAPRHVAVTESRIVSTVMELTYAVKCLGEPALPPGAGA